MARSGVLTPRKILNYAALAVLVMIVVAALWITHVAYDPVGKLRAELLMGPQPQVLTVVTEGPTLKFRDLNKNGKLDPYEDSRRRTPERVNDLLAQMTLEEKVGQMFHPAVTVKGGLPMLVYRVAVSRDRSTERQIQDQLISHFNYYGAATPEELAARLNQLQSLAARTRLGIPLTISSDPIHEVPGSQKLAAFTMDGISKWPSQLGLAATRDAELVEEFGRIAAAEYRAMGLQTALHPMADLATEPRWARHFGTFGSNADLSSSMTTAYMRGFQRRVIGNSSVLAMVKHFPGGGPQEDGLDPHLPTGQNQVYPGGYFNYHLAPFVNAINQGLRVIMPYYGIVTGEHSENVAIGFDRYLLTELLREQLGFDGVVCSDWSIVSTRFWGVEALSIPERYRKAIDAGIDQFGGESGTDDVIGMVRDGLLDEARIDASVARILANKFDLGLFENPFVDEDTIEDSVNRGEYVAKGLEAQRRSIVLLRNKADARGRPVLPLSRDTKIYVDGLDATAAAAFGTVVTRVADADYVVLFLPSVFNGTQEPGSDNLEHFFVSTVIPNGDLDYSAEIRQKATDYAAQKPLIVVADLNRPAILHDIDEVSHAVVGTFGVFDSIIFEAVFGAFNPSGKLPFEIPASMDAVRQQAEDLPDDTLDPTFAFGAGLSYPPMTTRD